MLIASPNPSRDRILTDEKLWGMPVELGYTITPDDFAIEFETFAKPDIVVFDCTSPLPAQEKFIKVLEKLETDTPILILTRNRVPKALTLLTERNNVFCSLFSTNNNRHLLCSLKRIRSYINLIWKKHIEDSLKNFIEGLYTWTLEKEKEDFHNNIGELLEKISNFFDFNVAFALEQERGNGFNLYGNLNKVFCPHLLTSGSSRRICEDIMTGDNQYLPTRFFKDNTFIFNATEELLQILISTLKGTNTCGLCQTFDYKSIIFLPFKVGDDNWLLMLCDKNIGKANESTYYGVKSIIPALCHTILFLKERSSDSQLIDLYKSVLASGKIGIWEYDIEKGKITSVGLKSLFPYLKVPGELNEWWQYIHPEDRQHFWHAVKPCIKGLSDSFAVDHRLLLPGDRVVWVRTIGECKEKRGNVPIRLTGIGIDITIFKQKEKELKDLRESLRVASEVGNIGLWSWDITKNIYSVNNPGVKILGLEKKNSYTLEDWLNKIPSTFVEEIRLDLGRVLSQGQKGILNIEYQIREPGGVNKWIHTYGRVTKCDSRGNPRVLSGSHIDITTRKVTEKQLMINAIVSSRYASLARSLLRVDDVEKIAELVTSTTLDITGSEVCFTGYTTNGANFHIIGISKSREKVYEKDWDRDEICKEFEILGQALKADVPLIINDTKGTDIRVFGDRRVKRILFIPTTTPEGETVFVMDLNPPEPYSPSHIEALEWLSSTFAQAYSRTKLELSNAQKTKELEETVKKLQTALATVKKLHGLLPICARCKKIRDDAGYWHEVEVYIRQHSEAEFTHGLCPQCAKELYGDFAK